MKYFTSHYTAAHAWSIKNLDVIFAGYEDDAQQNHITYVCKSERRFTTGQVTHLCTRLLPAGAVVSRDEKFIASAELVFLQLANQLDIHRTILLGLQLCAYPPGQSDKALTTKQKLINFSLKMKGHRGTRRALQALRYVKNGSASIMESLAYMKLALPNFLGGYGLSDLQLNYEIHLKNEKRRYPSQQRYFVDIYYKDAKLAVEYDSHKHHQSPLEQGRDAMRAAILEKQGISVVSFKTIQLYNEDAFQDFAENLAKRLGKRIRIKSVSFHPMSQRLQELLPRQSPILIHQRDNS